MFASIASSYPREPLPAQPDRVGEADRQLAAGSIDETAHAAVIDEFVREVVQEQEEAGLGVLTDGGVRWTDPFIPLIAGLEGLTAGPVVDSFEPGIHVTRPDIAGDIAWRRPIYAAAWSFAAAQTELPVKQVVPGPHTLGRIAGLDGRSRESVTMAFAEAMNAELIALVEAGCLIIQVDESGAATIEDDAERVLFSDAQRRLLDGLENPQLVHLSLAVLGGSAATAGAATMFEAPYSSYLFDLVRGPGNWQLVLQAPFDRGIVCGVETSQTSGLEDVETLVYAIAFAATSMERSMARVGVAPNGSLASISRHAARRKAERLAYAIGIAGAGPGPDVAAALVPNPAETRRFPGVRLLNAAYREAREALRLELPGPVALAAAAARAEEARAAATRTTAATPQPSGSAPARGSAPGQKAAPAQGSQQQAAG